MKIGVIADTHDNVPMVRKAIEVFNNEGCRMVFHAGDYCSPFSLNPFSDLRCKWLGVFGNNDGDKKSLAMKSDGLIIERPYKYELAEKKVIITHEIELVGDVEGKLKRKEIDILIYAHTHKPDIRKIDGALIVNPGECGGWLYGKSTIAIIEVDTMDATTIELK